MLQRLQLDGIKLPTLYIAENRADTELAMSKGIPFIRWNRGQDELIKILLRPVLERMFPHILWNKVLGPRRRFRTIVERYETGDDMPTDEVTRMDDTDSELLDPYDRWEPGQCPVEGDFGDTYEDEDGTLMELSTSTTGERLFRPDEGSYDLVVEHKIPLSEYAGDLSSCVNIEVLQRLRLMPAFIGDILDCIKINVGNGMHWREGYNKRRGLPVGRFDSAGQLPNLVILDVSGSIPRGISATMIALIDTLRTELSADLIITSSHSRFYPMGSELPDPQRIRDMFGYGNEAADFFGILTNDIRGKHYGHVFSFGDNDTPDYFTWGIEKDSYCLEGTVVEHVHHYHTWDANTRTGYAKWCHKLARQPVASYDTSWCKVIER